MNCRWYRETRRRDLFNKKRSRKELSKRLLSLDFTVLEQEAATKAEQSDEDEDGFFTGTTVCPRSLNLFCIVTDYTK